MVEITSPENLSEWLAGKSSKLAAAIASRIALRVLPVAIGDYEFLESETGKRLASNLFRASLISWSARNYRYKLNAYNATLELTAAHAAYAISAAHAFKFSATITPAARAVCYATHAVGETRAKRAIAQVLSTVRAAVRAAEPHSTEIWQAISADCSWCDASSSSADVQVIALWPAGIPDWFNVQWQIGATNLLRSSSGWKVWIDWFECRINGDASEWSLLPKQSDDLNLRILTARNGWWKAGEKDPSLLTAQIKEWIVEIQSKDKPQNILDRFDFFISYANEDEAMARELSDILQREGYSTFAQFKDFGPGNFVTEMNRGLAASSRFVALYSQDYFASPHCRAEWAAAYNDDPDGARWHILPFLLDPCELPPLAKQVVYTSLIGLNKTKRVVAILAAARRQPQQIGREVAANIAQDIVSPQPIISSAGKLALAPHPVFDQPITPQDMLDPIRSLIILLDHADVTLGHNCPLMVRLGLARVSTDLKEFGRHACWGGLERLLAAAEASFRASGEREFDAGEKSLLEDIFSLFSKCQTNLRSSGERLRDLSEMRVDEAAVGAAVTTPVQALSNASEILAEAGLTEPSFDQGIKELIRLGDDQAYRSNAESKGPLPLISARKAWVVGALGVAGGTYNLLGSTASLATLPVVQQAMSQLSVAIDWLIKLIL